MINFFSYSLVIFYFGLGYYTQPSIPEQFESNAITNGVNYVQQIPNGIIPNKWKGRNRYKTTKIRRLIDKKDYHEAISLLLSKQDSISNDFEEYHLLFSEEIITGYIGLGNYKAAIDYGEAILIHAHHNEKSYRTIVNLHGELSLLYKKQGHFHQSLEHKEAQFTYLNNSYKRNLGYSIIRMEKEITRKNEIALTNLENQEIVNTSQIVIHQNLYMLIGGVFLLLVIVIYLLFLQNRIKKNKILQIKAELKNKTLEEQLLHEKFNTLNHEIISKNKLINGLKNNISDIEVNDTILNKVVVENDWLAFITEFDKQYNNFLFKLESAHPELTDSNLRLAALMKLKLSNKEIASILNITENGVKKAKQRFKEKINTKKGSHFHQIHEFL